jgi:hypothetical protein
MRERKKMRRSEDFLVYLFTTQKQVKLHEASLHENNNEVKHFTKTSLHPV